MTRSSWYHIFGIPLLGLLLLVGFSEGFFLSERFRAVNKNNLPLLYSVDDEIKAAVSGQTAKSNNNNNDDDDTMSRRILQVAAGITQESCQMLGIKSVGVDYGLARTGIAVTVGYDPKPLTILSNLNATQVCEKVITTCRTEQANRIIVGLPLHKNGTEAEQTNLTRIFAAELANHAIVGLGPSVPVFLFDERYTSKEAAARINSKNPKSSDLYGLLDAEAACIILESYYNDNGIGAEPVIVQPELYERYKTIWDEKKLLEEERLDAAQKDRDARVRWRKEVMERDREREQTLLSSTTQSDKKKKKKKKKK